MVALDVFQENYLPEVIINKEKEQERIKDFPEDALKGMSKTLCVSASQGLARQLQQKMF